MIRWTDDDGRVCLCNDATPAEKITDGYEDIPFWCRQSTRKQSYAEPKFDGRMGNGVYRTEYDQYHGESKCNYWYSDLYD